MYIDHRSERLSIIIESYRGESKENRVLSHEESRKFFVSYSKRKGVKFRGNDYEFW